MSFFMHLHDTLVPSARNQYRPHALSRKSLSLFSGLLLSAKLLTVFSVDAVPVGHAFSAAVTPANIIQLTNASREGAGIGDLTENAQLDAAAQAKANDMLANQYFAHTSPAGKTPWDFISNSGYNYIIAGENLALNFFTAESTEQAWMNSPEHRSNILNSNFENIGVGVSQGEYNGVAAIFVVQEFGTPLPESYAIQQAATPTAAGTSDAAATTIVASAAKPAVPHPALQVQATVSKAVAAPTLDQPIKTLIRGDSTTVSGTAQSASVYLAVNGVQQIQVPVVNGQFTATLSLDPGNNAITATASDNASHVSVASNAITYITAMVMPQVLSAQVNPLPLDGGSSLAYQLVVHTLPSATSVNASYGNVGVVLQPTSIAGEWQTTIPASQLAQTQLVVHAYDMAGNVASSQQIAFTSTIADNYGFQAVPKQATVPILGKQISEAALNDLYIAFALVMMVIIGIVIASRVPVADVGMIAQTAGLIAVSVLLWVH
jgi:hypothetical protein